MNADRKSADPLRRTPFRFKSPTIRITIMTAFISLLVLTAVPIVGYMHYRNRDATLELADEIMLYLSEAAIEKTAAYLRPASVMAEMSARLAELDGLALTAPSKLESHAIAVLRAHPQLAMFNMGDERGNFLMPKKMDDGSIATKIIDRDVDPPVETWIYRDVHGAVVRTETTIGEPDYDPRERSWYVGAKEANGAYWTDMYVLFTDQVPGIATSYPVTDAEGRLLGVFGLDIELGAVSTFLQALDSDRQGVAFIFNEKGEAVAYPDVSRIVVEESGDLRSALVEELGDPRVAQCLRHYRATGAARFVFTIDNVDYIGSVVNFPQSSDKNWKIGMVVPQDAFIGGLRRTARNTLLISLGILLTAMLFARLLSRSISRPVTALVVEARAIQDFDLDNPITLKSLIKEIQDLRDALANMKTGLSAFRRYVPAALVKQLVQTGEAARLGGDERELTIFFSDIAGFTPLSETLSPEALMLHLSKYFDEMTHIIVGHRGTIDKYIGDSIMAFWGAPLPQPNHAALACLAALDCARRVNALNAQWEAEGKTPLHTRIGIHTGRVVVGNIGSSERMNYSALGDAVNIASRLEGANKAYGVSIIISQVVREQAGDRFLCRPLDRVAVLGKRQGVMIYELVGDRQGDIPADAEALCEGFSAALDAYFGRDWPGAGRMFEDLGRAFPHDAPTALFRERCRQMASAPPPDDWDGTTRLREK